MDNAESKCLQMVEAIRNIRVERQKLGLPKEDEYGADVNTKNILKERRNLKELKRKAEIQVGDMVRIKTIRFGKLYAKDRPKYTQGKVVGTKGKKVAVVYEGGEESYDTYKSHLEKLEVDELAKDDDVVATIIYQGKRYKKSQTFYTIMAALEVGSGLKRSQESEESSWPKDFYEALVRNDWREWVGAVQKENESWRTFNASEEVLYENMERGASIIPLGELYTIKRNGQHKIRQYGSVP
jgi:hypothetical protein